MAVPIALGVLGTAIPGPAHADGSANGNVTAAPPNDLGNMKEEVLRLPFDTSPGSITLQTTLFEPTSGGRHPLVLMSHGTPRSSEGLLRMSRWRPVAQARWFVERGFVVAIPMRRGYAMSTGTFSESYGSCDAPDFVGAGRASAMDLKAAITALSARADIDTSKTILLGHSGGGFASLALGSESLPGVVGILNFAGGRGSVMSGAVCSPDRMASAMQTFGSTTKVPSLWLYAKNDTAFSPFIAKMYFNAFGGEKQHAHFVELPAFKSDGHQVITEADGMALWTGPAQKFLDQLKIGAAPQAQSK
ncbi:MAG: hypothetical protein ABI461_10315 [Polyangiaceae bacterium]